MGRNPKVSSNPLPANFDGRGHAVEVGPVSGRRLHKLAGVTDGSGSRSTRRSILRSPGSSASRPSADKRNRVEWTIPTVHFLHISLPGEDEQYLDSFDEQ